MNNVDTMTLGMNLEDRRKKIKLLFDNKIIVDYEYVRIVDEKIKNKLVLDEKNRKKLQKVREIQNTRKKLDIFRLNKSRDVTEIYMYGKDEYYSFFYNTTRHTLSITILHDLIENYTADEIINNTNNELMRYFDLTKEELNPLTLRRIDYFCDYRYRDDLELEIIKNINLKTADYIYPNYRKELEDSADSYIVKYLSFKEKKQGVD